MDQRLSTLQRNILEFLDESHAESDWGVRWRPGKRRPGWSAVDRADVSRALARLEQRGYVLRQNQHQSRCPKESWATPGNGEQRKSPSDPLWGRSTHVQLLAAGQSALEEHRAGRDEIG
jgi:hypothetical protein